MGRTVNGAVSQSKDMNGNSDWIGGFVVTSGDGGMFPEGIPVGVVTSMSGGTVKVQPYADVTRIDYVSAIDYKF